MEIKQIIIAERASYERTSERDKYRAKIQLKGGSDYPADINIDIPEEMLAPIVGIIQQAVVTAMARAAEEFRSNVEASLAGPVIEQIEDNSDAE